MVHLSNGGRLSFFDLTMEIGNHGYDSWENVHKIRKSSSDKNRFEYIKKFENELAKLGVL